MKLLLGIHGYVGKKVWESLYQKRIPSTYLDDIKYIDIIGSGGVKRLEDYISKYHIDTLINCVGYVGHPNVDACEDNKDICYTLNYSLPLILAKICNELDITYCHVGTGCIYNGDNGGDGFTEEDIPNIKDKMSFYSVCKYQAEKHLGEYSNVYNLRLRMPFSKDMNCKRNILNKLRTYKYILSAKNSLTNIDEYVDNLIYCITNDVEYGTYNMCNEGGITSEEIIILLRSYGLLNKPSVAFLNEEEFREKVTSIHRSSCVLNVQKAKNAGMKFKDIKTSIKDCLNLL